MSVDRVMGVPTGEFSVKLAVNVNTLNLGELSSTSRTSILTFTGKEGKHKWVKIKCTIIQMLTHNHKDYVYNRFQKLKNINKKDVSQNF